MIEHVEGAQEAAVRLTTADLPALIEQIAIMSATTDDRDAVERLDLLERVKSAAAAAQALATTTLAAERREHLEAIRTRARAEGRVLPVPDASVGAEVGLARRIGPHQGRRQVEVADALTTDLPHTLAALAVGDISEHRAATIVTETRDLSPEDRQLVDAELHAPRIGLDPLPDGTVPTLLHGLGDRALRDLLRTIVARIDAEAAAARWRRARARRKVVIRPLGDGTSRITAIVAQEHAAAIGSRLDHAAETVRNASSGTDGDERTRDQVRADAFVQGLLGGGDLTERLPAPEVRVNLVISAATLFGHDPAPGTTPGHGPVPAPICLDLIRDANRTARATLRRLFTTPDDTELVAMESRSRTFPKPLAELVHYRDDGRCRTLWCDAPIRHVDHAEQAQQGGSTSFENAQGLCESCNYVKETAGWVTWVGDGFGPQAVHTLTPTCHLHTSHPPPRPEWVRADSPAASHGLELVYSASPLELDQLLA